MFAGHPIGIGRKGPGGHLCTIQDNTLSGCIMWRLSWRGLQGGCPARKFTRHFWTTHFVATNVLQALILLKGTRVQPWGQLFQFRCAMHTYISH